MIQEGIFYCYRLAHYRKKGDGLVVVSATV